MILQTSNQTNQLSWEFQSEKENIHTHKIVQSVHEKLYEKEKEVENCKVEIQILIHELDIANSNLAKVQQNYENGMILGSLNNHNNHGNAQQSPSQPTVNEIHADIISKQQEEIAALSLSIRNLQSVIHKKDSEASLKLGVDGHCQTDIDPTEEELIFQIHQMESQMQDFYHEIGSLKRQRDEKKES